MMKKNIKGIIALLFVLGCFTVAIYGAVQFFGFILDHLKQLDHNVSAALVSVCGTFLISLITVLIAKHFEHKAEIRREQHDKKVGIYEEFIVVWYDVLFAEKLGKKKPTDEETAAKLLPLVRQLIPWASNDFIKSFVKFRNMAPESQKKNQGGVELLDSFEKVLFDIRKDLGHSNSGLRKGDISRLFINDYDEFAQKHTSQKGESQNG